MDLTIATPLRFTISDSTMDSDYTTSLPPIKTRENMKSSILREQPREDEKKFFKPKLDASISSKPAPFETVSGTLWALEYSTGGSYILLHDKLTTKELKAFINTEGVTARAASAITFIENTLSLAESHADKYNSYTAVDYNILELMNAIYKSKVFEDTEIGNRAKHFIEILYADQLADNDKHTAREAFKDKFNGDAASIEYLTSIGIIQ